MKSCTNTVWNAEWSSSDSRTTKERAECGVEGKAVMAGRERLKVLV